MKNYEKIVEIGCFSLGELAKKLNCCVSTAASLIQAYIKKDILSVFTVIFMLLSALKPNSPYYQGIR